MGFDLTACCLTFENWSPAHPCQWHAEDFKFIKNLWFLSSFFFLKLYKKKCHGEVNPLHAKEVIVILIKIPAHPISQIHKLFLYYTYKLNYFFLHGPLSRLAMSKHIFVVLRGAYVRLQGVLLWMASQNVECQIGRLIMWRICVSLFGLYKSYLILKKKLKLLL